MREREIERVLVRAVEKNMGWALKMASTGKDGVPDRIILMPHGKMAFCELKRPGGKMRPLQLKRKAQLESLGFKVFCIDGKEQIGGMIDEIQSI